MSQLKHISLLRKGLASLLLTTVLIAALGGTATAATYYGKPGQAPNLVASWGTNPGGTGTAPANFTTAGDIFIIENGTTMTATAVWTIGAAGATASTLQINGGGSLAMSTFLLTLASCDFSNAGTYSGSGGVTISGTLAANSIAGFTTTGTVSMTKTGGTATFQGNVDGAGLTINGTGGTLNLGTGLTHTFSGAWTRTNGTLNGGSSTLNIAGSISGTGGTFTASSSTVNYNGVAQTAAVVIYNNLTVSGSLAKTFGTTPTVNGILSMEGTATITVSTGVVTYGTNATLQYNTTTARTSSLEEWITPFAATGGVIISSTGAITMNAAKVFSAGVPLTINNGATLIANTFLLTLGGNFTRGTGTFTSTTGGVTISGAAATQSIAGFTTTGLVSMTKTAGTATFTGNVNGAGFTLSGLGGTLDLGAGLTHTFTGPWTRTNGTLLGNSSTLQFTAFGISGTGGTFTAGTSTVIWSAGSNLAIAGLTYYNLTISNANTKTLNAATTVNGNLTVNAGTLANGGFQITGNGTGTLTVANGATLQIGAGTATITSFPTNFTTANIALGPTSTVNYSTITNAQNVAGSVAGVGPSTYGHLTVTGASGTKTLTSGITVAGNLTIATAGGTFANGGFTVTVNGNVTNNATHSGLGKILLSGGSASHTVTGTTSTYGNLELDDVQGATFANTTTTTTVSTLTVTAGTLTLNSFATSLTVTTTNVSGTLTFNNATGTRSMGAVTVNSGGVVNVTVAQATPLITVSSLNINGGTWNNTTVNEPVTISTGTFTNTGTFNSGTGTYTFSAASTSINGNATTFSRLTINSATGTTNNITDSGGLTVTTTLAGTGTLIQAASANLFIGAATVTPTLTAIASGNTVNYSGAAQTVKVNTYHHLILSNSGVKTFAVTAVNGDLTLTGTASATTGAALVIGANLSVGDGTTFTAAGFALTVTGTTTVGAGTSGNLTITSATGTKIFTGLVTVNAGGTWTNTAANSPVTFRGGITNSNTFNAGTGVHTFDTNSQALTGTFSIANVTVTGAAVVLTNNGTLTVGTALIGTGDLTNAATGTLNIGGTSTITGMTATAAGNTVNYYSTTAAATIKGTTYHHLIFNKSTVTSTLGAATTVNGNFTVSAGTLNTNNLSLSVSGTTSVDGTLGVTTGTAGTIAFDTLTVNGTGIFNNTAFNDAVTINGSLTNSGTFNAGSGVYTLTGASGGTQTITGTLSIPSLTVDGTYSNAATLTVATALAGSGTLTQANGSTLNLGGTTTITSLDASTNSNLVNFNGTGSQTIPAQNFYNLTISGNRGTQAITFASGTIGVAGTFSVTATNTSYVLTGNTIDFNGTGSQTVGVFNYNNLTISGNRGTQAITLASGTIGVAGTLSVTATNTSYVLTGNTIDFNGTGSQTVGVFNYNNLTISGNKGGQAVTLASGTVGVAGTFSVTATNATYVTAGSTIDFNGSGSQTIPAFNYNNLTSSSFGARTLASSGTIGVAGAFTKGTNTYTATGSTISYNGTGSQTITDFIYENLTIANTTVAVAASTNIDVAGNLTVDANAILAPSSTSIVSGVTGTLTGSGTVQVTRTAATPDLLTQYTIGALTLNNLTVEYVAGAAQTISDLDYGTLKITGGSRTVTFPVNSIIGIAGSFVPDAGATYVTTNSAVNYNGSSPQTAAAFTYEDLRINNAAGVTMGGNVTVDSVLYLTSGTFSIGANTLKLNGFPISASAGTLASTASSNLEMRGGTMPSTFIPSSITTLKKLLINVSPTSNKVTHSGQLTVNDTLTLTDGIFDNMPVTADTLILTSTASVNRINGRVRGAISRWVAGDGTLYYPTGGNDLITPVTLTFSGVTTLGYVTVRMYFADHPSGGTSGIDTAKSVNRYYGIYPNFPGGGFPTSVDATIGFGGVPPDDMNAGAIPANFIVRQYNGTTWFKTTVGTRTGTSTQATGLAVNQAYTYFVGEQLVKTWDGGASTNNWGDANNWAPANGVPTALEDVSLAGANTIDINVAATTNSLTLNNGSAVLTILSGNTLTVTGNLSLLSGTMNTQGAFPAVSGSTTISGGTVGYTAASGSQNVEVNTYNNLTIGGGGTKTLLGTITPAGDLTISGGLFDLQTFTANRSTSGGTLTLASGASLKIGGTNTLPSNYGTHSVGATSTVEYSGSSQAVGALNSSQSYGHLTLSGSGTKTFPAGTTGISGDLTRNAGTIDATTNNSTVDFNGSGAQAVASGDYKNLTFSNAGIKTFAAGTSRINNTFTISGTASANATTNSTTIEYNGTTSQTARAFTYYNLTINNSADVSIPANVTVNNLLTLTSGNLNTGSNTLTIATGGTLARTSGYVIGKLAKTVSGAALTPTFEIGDATAYTPVSFTFASVSVAGTLTVSTTAGDHFQIVTSGINSSKSVNRYWSLTNSGISFTTYKAGFKFVAGDIDGGATPSAFIVALYNGSSWNLPAVGSKGADSTEATSLTGFGDFQIGEAASGVVKTWDGGAGTNNWEDASNWNPDGVPGSADDVNLNDANTININSAALVNSMTLNHVSLVLSVQSVSLTASGNLTLTNGTLNVSTAVFPGVAGTVSITGGTVAYVAASGSQTVRALSYNNLTLSGAATKTIAAGTTGVAGNFTVSGGAVNATTNTTTINFNGSGSQGVAAIDYHKLIFSSTGTRTFASGTTGIADTLFITGGSTDATTNSSTIDFKGGSAQPVNAINYYNLNLSNAGVKTFAAGTTGIANALTLGGTASADATTNATTINFNGGGAQTVNALTYHDLTLSNAGVKTFASGTTNITGDFLLSGSATGNGTTNSTTININGSVAQAVAAIDYNVLSFSGGNTKTFGTGTATIAGNFTISGATGNATSNSTTVNFNGGGAQSVPAMNYHNLTLSNAGVKTLASGTTGISNVFSITGSASVNEVTNSTTVDFNGGGAQTIPVGAYYNVTASNAGTKTFASGTTTIAGDFMVSGGASANGTTNSTTIDYNGGGAQAVAAINYHNITLSNAGTKTFATGTSRIAGAFTISGSASPNFAANTATIEYNGSSSQTVRALTYANLSINNASGVTIPGNVTVDGTLNFMSGNVATSANKITVGSSGSTSRTSGHVIGNFEKFIPTIAPLRTFEIGDGSAYTPVTVNFASVSTGGFLTVTTTATDHPNISGATIIDSTLTANRYWTLTGGPGSFTNYSATFTFVAGDLDVSAVPTNFIVGRYSASTWTYPTYGTRTGTTTQATGLTAFGDFQLGEQQGVTKTWVGLSGDLNWNTAVNWNNGTVPISTDNVNLTSIDSSIAVNTAAVCKNLTMNSTGLVLTVTTGNSLTLSGALTMTNGKLVTQVGFPTVTGSVTLNGGTVEYSAAGIQTISTQTYNKLTLSGSGNKSATGNLTVNDSLQVLGTAVFDAGTSRTHTLKGHVIVNSSAGTPFIFTTDNTINFNTPGTPAARSLGGSATLAFNAINFNNTSGFNINQNFSASGIVTVASNVTLTPGAANIISGAGTLTGNGTVQVTRTTATADFNSQYTITNKTLTNLTVEYAASSQVLSSTTYGGLRVSGSITGSTSSATVGGAFTVTGTFTQTSGTITMNNGSSIAASGALTVFNLAIANSSTVTTSSSFTVGGALTVGTSSVFSPSAGTITMTNGASIANSGTLTFKALTIDNSATVTTSTGFSVGGALTVGTSSVFNPSNGTITLDNGASIANSGTLTFSGLTIAASATVTTASSFSVGGALTVGASAVFGPSGTSTATMNSGASIANSGTLSFKTLTTASNAVITASGNFTVTADLTLVGASSSLTSSGNITVNGNVTNPNTIAGAGAIILTGGGSAHALTGGTFTNVTLNDALGATASTNITVSGTLTLTSGVISMSTNTLTIGASGSVSRTSGHVFGTLAKNLSTGAQTPTFEIGDATNYTPVSLSIANVTGAGTLTAKSTAGDNPNISSSTISAANSANRYWTLGGTLTFTTTSVTFTFVSGDVDGGADPLQFVVGRYATATWSYPSVGTRTSTSTQATGIAAFGEFQLGMSAGGTRISFQTGNWNTAATWTSNIIPGLGDSVVIASGHTVTIDVNTAAVRAVTISGTAVLTGGAVVTLTIGAGTGGTDFLNDGTFTANNVTVKLNTNSQWAGTGTFNLKDIDFNAKSLTLAFAGANTVYLAGTGDPILNAGTLVPGTTSTIEYNGTSGQNISGSATINFRNLRITNSSTVTLQKNLNATNLTGNLTITSGGVLNTANGATAFDITGNSAVLTVDASSTLNLGGNGSAASSFPTGFTTVTLNTGSTVQYSNSSGTSQPVAGRGYDNILFSGSGTKSLGSGTSTVSGNWTNNATGGSLNTGTSVVNLNGSTKSIAGTAGTTFSTLNVNGTYTNNATTTVNAALGGSGTLTQGSSATLNINFAGSVGVTALDASASGNTVNYQFSGNQTVRTMNHVNLTLSGSGTKTLSGGTTGISNNLTISGVTVDALANSSTVNYNGGGNQTIAALGYFNLSLSNAGTKTFPTGTTSIAGALSVAGATADATTNNTTIDYNGSGAQSIGAIAYKNLTLSNANTKTFPGGTSQIAGDFTVTGSAAANAITNSSTIDFNGSGPQAVAAISFYNLTLSNANTKTLAAGTTGIAGTLTISGTATANATANSTTVDYNGSGAQNVTAMDYSTLRISGGGTKTLASGTTTIAADLNIAAGTFDLGTNAANRGSSGGTLTVASGAELKLSGSSGGITGSNFPSNFTTNTLSGTVEFSGAGAQTVPALQFTGLTLSSAGTKTFSSGTTSIAGNFAVSGGTADATANGGTIDFNGSGAQNVAGISYNNLTFSISGTKTFLAGTTSIVGTFTISGTAAADATTNATTIDYAGTSQTVLGINYTNLTLSNSGTKTFASGTTGIAGTFSITGGTADLLTNGTTINYNGSGTQTIRTLSYHNLSLSTGGAKTFNTGTTQIAGNFAISGATADATTNTTTIVYNGTGAQSVAGITYHSLTFTNAGLKTMAAPTIVNAGIIINAGADVIVTSTLQVTGNVVNDGVFTNEGTITVN